MSKKILLVEDEALIAMAEAHMLKKHGYEVVTAYNGEKAIEAVESDPDISLILMDIDLGPGMDGTEAAEKILNKKDMPIVFLSSHTEPEVVAKTEKITSYGYVVKNSGATVLDASIKMAFKLFAAKNEAKEHEENLRESEATIRERLKAITETGGDISTLKLADIIDYEALQTMMEDFYSLSGIGGAIVDTSGKILVGVAWQEICSRFHRVHPDTQKHCLESDLSLTKGVSVGTSKAYHCKNNMWDIVTPIVVNEKHLGNMFIGQFFFEDEAPDYDLFRKQARQYGFDETEYLAALDRVPRFSRETVDRAIAFYSRLAGMISSLSYTTIKLSRNMVQYQQAEERLHESEEKFRAFVENANDIIYQLTPEGVFTYVSPNWTDVLGYQQKEVIGETVEKFVHSDDLELCIDFLNRVLTTGKKQSGVEYRVKHKNGAWRWHNSNGAPIKDRNGRIISYVGIAREITERKKAEDELKADRDLLNATQKIAKVGGWEWDVATDTVTWSEELYNITGLDPNFPPPQFNDDHHKIYTKKSWKKLTTVVEQTLKTGEPYEIYAQIVRPDGERRDVYIYGGSKFDTDGSISGLFGIVQDITEKNQREKQLRESEENLRTTLNSIGDAVISTDIEGAIIRMNPVAESLCGWSIDEAEGKPLTEVFHIVHADTGDKAENPVGKVLETGNIVELANHTMLISRDGTQYQIADSAAPIRDDDDNTTGVVLVFRDVTEDYRVAQALADRERDMARAQTMAQLGSWRFDLDSGVVITSDQARRIYGVDEGELTIEYVQSLVLPEYRPKLDAAFTALVENGTPYDIEFQIRRPSDNMVRNIHSTAEYDTRHHWIVGTIQDITELKRAEEALKAKNSLLEKVFDNNIDLIALTDLEGNYQMAGNAHRILGYEIEDLIGKNVMDFVHPEDISYVGREFSEFVQSGDTRSVEYRYRRIDGEYVWFETTGTVLKDENGRPEQILFNTRDITERKRAEEEIQRQLAEKETLLREVNHRIKNSISQVEGLLSLQASSTDNALVKSALQDAISRVGTIRTLYEKLLIGKEHYDVSTKEYAESVIDSLVAVYSERKDVTLEKRIADVNLSSKTAIPLGIIINELLTNVFKYAFEERDGGRVVIELVKRENQITLTIHDDGVGIDKGGPANESAGFGLTLVKMLAEQLDATYTMENDNGTKSVLSFSVAP